MSWLEKLQDELERSMRFETRQYSRFLESLTQRQLEAWRRNEAVPKGKQKQRLYFAMMQARHECAVIKARAQFRIAA